MSVWVGSFGFGYIHINSRIANHQSSLPPTTSLPQRRCAISRINISANIVNVHVNTRPDRGGTSGIEWMSNLLQGTSSLARPWEPAQQELEHRKTVPKSRAIGYRPTQALTVRSPVLPLAE